MKSKTKLIATLMAMCLVITLGVFGILAVKTLNMSVGGNITFTADGISFEVSKGEFKTTSGAEYTDITSQTGKLQGFAMNTNTKLADVQDKINSWAGLDLVATESLGDPVLHFSITNLMEDEILSFNPSITLGTNINENMEIKIDPAVANIQPTQEQNFTITFHVKDTSINAGLTGENYSGFAIDILLSTAVVADPSTVTTMTFAETATGSNEYVVSNCSSATGDVVIPAFVKQNGVNYPVTEIANGAFSENYDITSIIIPNTVTKIGVYSFDGCPALSSVIIGNGVTTIGNYAFERCGNLSNLKIGNSVKIIGKGSFGSCTNLTTLRIPDNVTTIMDSSFSECSSLTSVIIGNGVTSIGNYAFVGCNKLTDVIIGSNVTTIGEGAFFNCFSLTNVTIPNSVTTIGNSTFENCGELSGELVIPDNVTTIGEAAFRYCEKLTSLSLGINVINIGYGAFEGCALEELVIPNSVQYIGAYAFNCCASLTSVIIGEGVISIDYGAFEWCTNLTEITILAENPPTIQTDSFNQTNNCPIYVPNSTYLTSWSDYSSRIVVA